MLYSFSNIFRIYLISLLLSELRNLSKIYCYHHMARRIMYICPSNSIHKIHSGFPMIRIIGEWSNNDYPECANNSSLPIRPIFLISKANTFPLILLNRRFSCSQYPSVRLTLRLTGAGFIGDRCSRCFGGLFFLPCVPEVLQQYTTPFTLFWHILTTCTFVCRTPRLAIKAVFFLQSSGRLTRWRSSTRPTIGIDIYPIHHRPKSPHFRTG